MAERQLVLSWRVWLKAAGGDFGRTTGLRRLVGLNRDALECSVCPSILTVGQGDGSWKPGARALARVAFGRSLREVDLAE